MKTRAKIAIAIFLAGLCWPVIAGVAAAGNNVATRHAAMREACTEQGGRFELSWMYNDQVVRWGEVLSCTTNAGYVRCESDRCRASRWLAGKNENIAYGGNKADGPAVFAAEPVSFSDALATLSGH